MRTKFLTAVAAALLTIGTASAALAQAADTQADATDATSTVATTGPNYTYGGFAPNVGPSAHYHPHGTRHR